LGDKKDDASKKERVSGETETAHPSWCHSRPPRSSRGA